MHSAHTCNVFVTRKNSSEVEKLTIYRIVVVLRSIPRRVHWYSTSNGLGKLYTCQIINPHLYCTSESTSAVGPAVMNTNDDRTWNVDAKYLDYQPMFFPLDYGGQMVVVP